MNTGKTEVVIRRREGHEEINIASEEGGRHKQSSNTYDPFLQMKEERQLDNE